MTISPMSLQSILDYFGNPMSKMYNTDTGDLAMPMGGDAGEVYYLILTFSPALRKWRVGRRSQPLPFGEWREAIRITEDDLIKISDDKYRSAC